MKCTSVLLQSSSYSIGLQYELLVLKVLGQCSFRLTHTGGRGDRGADFVGQWELPSRTVPVIGQCKCHRKAVGPSGVREFESVLLRRSQSSGVACTGILISHSWFSPGSLKLFHSSKCPLILCQIQPQSSTTHGEQDGFIRELALNAPAKSITPEVLITTKVSTTHAHGSLGCKTVSILVRDSLGTTLKSLPSTTHS